VAGCIAGYLLYNDVMALISPFLEWIKKRIEETASISPHLFPVMFFANNTRASSLIGLLFGSVPVFGFLYALFALFFNGAVVGFVAHLPDKSLPYVLLGILPHCIFEVPAFLFAGVVAMRINLSIFKYILSHEEEARKEGANDALEAAKLFTLILPLLFIAALVESYITPLVLEWLG